MATSLGVPLAQSTNAASIRLLAVTPHPEDHASLERMLGRKRFTIFRAPCFSEALRTLAHDKPQVVVCERDLPDGDWKDLFREMGRLRNPPPFIVTSSHADEALWAEVLNFGGYDVLVKPFDSEEVDRVMHSARRAWDLNNLRRAVGSASL